VQAAKLSRLRSQCCSILQASGAGGYLGTPTCTEVQLTTKAAWKCIEDECREEYLRDIAMPIEVNSSEPATCKPCDAKAADCNDTFYLQRTIPVRPGFWRTNELSTTFHKCAPRACEGSRRGGGAGKLAQDVCRPGHWGVQCAACIDGQFKDISGLCHTCELDNTQLLLYTLTFVALVLFLVFLIVSQNGTGLIRELSRLRFQIDKLAKSLGGIRKQLPVIAPKVKALISMFQIMLNMPQTFALDFPEIFINWLAFFRIFNFLDLPFECLIRFDFERRLQIYIFLPLILFSTVVILSLCVTGALRSTLISFAFLMIFLLYPSITSIAFSTRVCDEFDDGTTFLRMDLSVSCDSPSYQTYLAYSGLMIGFYVVGIPLVYALVVLRWRHPLTCVRRAQEFLERTDAQTKISIHEEDLLVHENLDKSIYQQLQGEIARSVKRAEITRSRAYKRFRDWYPTFGIELDSTREEPFVKTHWPVHEPCTELTEEEEKAAFANYQRYRLLKVRSRSCRRGLARSLQALAATCPNRTANRASPSPSVCIICTFPFGGSCATSARMCR
jgi:hypothetical protein